MFLDVDSDLVYPYSKYYRLADFFNPHIKNALMIGGGAYSYPKDFLKKHPEARLDVVEIDPGVTALAQQYFNLKPSAQLHIYHEDGRFVASSILLISKKRLYFVSTSAMIPFSAKRGLNGFGIKRERNRINMILPRLTRSAAV
jgi:hypothetical protein